MTYKQNLLNDKQLFALGNVVKAIADEKLRASVRVILKNDGLWHIVESPCHHSFTEALNAMATSHLAHTLDKLDEQLDAKSFSEHYDWLMETISDDAKELLKLHEVV